MQFITSLAWNDLQNFAKMDCLCSGEKTVNETVHPQITYRLLVRQGQIKIILKEIISN